MRPKPSTHTSLGVRQISESMSDTSLHAPFLTFTVQDADDARRLEAVLRSRYHMARGLIRRLKSPGCVRVDGRPLKMRESVRTGQRVELRLPSSAVSDVRSEPIPICVVYEDADVLVIDKPPGILVHPAGVDRGGTLVNAVAHHVSKQGCTNTSGPVTRLDRDTSGLVLFAKHPHAHHRFGSLIEAGHVHREYLAFAHGDVTPSEGLIDAPIRRADGSLTRRVSAPDGQEARTRYRVVARYRMATPRSTLAERVTRLELSLETGRTHQIRVHLAHIGHPVVGDAMYGPERIPGVISRQALHAFRLTFTHPVNNKEVVVSSALPTDMHALTTLLSRDRAT